MSECEILIRVGAIVAQIFIGIAVFLSGRSIARAQYFKSIQNAWQNYNIMLLSNPDNLKFEKDYWKDDNGESISDSNMRERYIRIMQLNIHEAQHIGLWHGLYHRRDDKQTKIDLLKPLLEIPGVYEISQKRGFSSSFKKKCRKLMDK